VAFGPSGPTADTILTYSQATDPTSPFSSDQTRLFSKEKWVRWAFTPAQVAAGAISTRTVRGG
jgi:acyl-homoserine-lactone acylase